jgi:queuine tRNA-ribosyltransferase accessory subunit
MTSDGKESGMIFRLLKGTSADGAAARLGRLALPQRRPVETPNFLDITSRGSIPHLTPDVVGKHVRSHGAYYALEDCKQYAFALPTVKLTR